MLSDGGSTPPASTIFFLTNLGTNRGFFIALTRGVVLQENGRDSWVECCPIVHTIEMKGPVVVWQRPVRLFG